MGAALLSTPDLLCSILTALREAMPPEITVTAKIRLLPTQEETLKLVEKIVNTGISALTVHCRTRNMRKTERAVIERLREVVEFVEGMGKGIAVIHNGDCVGVDDAARIRDITGAHSCMIATAAESNPTCFSRMPLVDLERTFAPSYIRLCRYLDNHWASTKFCASQFKGPHEDVRKSERKEIKDALNKAKSYADLDSYVNGVWDGDKEMAAIVRSIESRTRRITALERLPVINLGGFTNVDMFRLPEQPIMSVSDLELFTTPPEPRENPEPGVMDTPRLPSNERLMPVPALISEQNVATATNQT